MTPGHTFGDRHIGPREREAAEMLKTLGLGSLDELVVAALPPDIRDETLDLPPAAGEAEVLAELREIAGRNRVVTSMIGQGYYDTVTPAVIRRNVLENPAWYTAYTPYQPEISQGRLEALLTFQTVVADLTGLPVANASLLDEGTAAAEAMALARRLTTAGPDVFVVQGPAHPQTLGVLRTRAEARGIEIVEIGLDDELPECFGVLLSYPTTTGEVRDLRAQTGRAHDGGALVVAATDLLALTLLTPPGEFGADIAVGSAQRFGVPMGFGGPHAAFLSTRAEHARMLPGRLVGLSVDADGAPAYRLALQTREQHIRREKATSNICTAQVLLAVMAAMYAVYHGPDGLTEIARRVHGHAAGLADTLVEAGLEVLHGTFFDTVAVRVPDGADGVVEAAARRDINLRRLDDHTVVVACDELTTDGHVVAVLHSFGVLRGEVRTTEHLPAALRRATPFLTADVFSAYRSETAMMRWLRRLADRDLALDRAMIPLGSCTMKLNSAVEMEAVSWPELARIHPFAPADQTAGYRELIEDLEGWLAEITGYDRVSVQPNAGSQGELAGLLAIRGYHRSRGDVERDVCLIPASAHGTNAASAVMAGMRVVVVRCDVAGNVDVDDMRAKIDQHHERLAALMVTYPSTHGVFEATIREVCGLVHDGGGQVYVDGANLNALVGLARPGRFGADVSHLNLHKTFCIPHGGGGPGVGPVAVRAHLAPYLASGIASAPHGSAGILPISWAYLRLMGPDDLRRATQTAILTANYVARRLSDAYPILYTGASGFVAHECILDLRPLTKASGVTVDDVAKRLIDYGFHAPTMSFPVAGTLMVEPTESEDLRELDRLCDAMIAIRGEIDRVASGEWDRADNPLRNAPHTAAMLVGPWDHPYDRLVGGYPAGVVVDKYWPPVRRIDQAYGDRHLVCACPPPAAFEEGLS